jgi:serine/threonine protein phosphatase PrpC
MQYFSTTYTDFIKFDKKPNEDFYLISKKFPIFVIGDGVTQSHFQSGVYAFPSGARAAAEIFCYTTLEYLENKLKKIDKKTNYKMLIKKAFDLANQRIKELNENEGITEKLDYLVYDYFDTVGVLGFLIGNILHYGYLGDCGLTVFDRKNTLKFQTKDQVKEAIEEIKKKIKNWDDLSQNKKTLIMHRDLRNNPSGKGYGSFSGEEGVKKYYRIGSLVLNPKDLIVFYSDGFLNYFKFQEFVKILRKRDKKSLDELTFQKAKENYEKYGTDRTLIAVEF